MNDSESSTGVKLNLATVLLFESGLGGMALGVGWLTGFHSAVGVDATHKEFVREALRALFWVGAATIPAVLALLLLVRFPMGGLEDVMRVTRQFILPLFRSRPLWHLAVISLAAGVNEELLFRGLIQGGLARLLEGYPWGWVAALLGASLLFGVCHWLNRTYAILAGLAGLYFGLLLVASGNIIAPMLAHALYDFVALCYLTRGLDSPQASQDLPTQNEYPS